MCVYMILKAPKTPCQTALEGEKNEPNDAERGRETGKQNGENEGKGGRKQTRGKKKGRRKKAPEFPPGGINTAR